MQAVIMARVSTDDQREGSSLEAQLHRLREYCGSNNISILQEYSFVESSVTKKRKNLQTILDFIKSRAECTALVVYMVDRLQRDFSLSPVIEELTSKGILELHFVHEGLIIDKNPFSAARMHWDAVVFGAKMSNRARVEHSMRGRKYKVENGEFPYMPPAGYKVVRDIRNKRSIVVDKPNAQKVKKLFELYATGIYSIEALSAIARDLKLKSEVSKRPKYQLPEVREMIRNPFYIGYMRIKKQYYKHTYEKFIDETLFQNCQSILWVRKHNRLRTSDLSRKGNYLLYQILKCRFCGAPAGCRMSSNGAPSYYCLAHRRVEKGNQCRSIGFRSDMAHKLTKEILSKLYLLPERREAIINHLKKLFPRGAKSLNIKIEEKNRLITSYDEKINALLTMRLNGEIAFDLFQSKLNLLSAEKAAVQAQHKKLYSIDRYLPEKIENFLDYASDAAIIYENGNYEDSQSVLLTVFDKVTFENRIIHFTFKPIFGLLASVSNIKLLKKALEQWYAYLLEELVEVDVDLRKDIGSIQQLKPIKNLPVELSNIVRCAYSLDYKPPPCFKSYF